MNGCKILNNTLMACIENVNIKLMYGRKIHNLAPASIESYAWTFRETHMLSHELAKFEV